MVEFFEILGKTLAVIGATFLLAFWISGVFDDDDEDLQ
jgi:hypothetical protein